MIRLFSKWHEYFVYVWRERPEDEKSLRFATHQDARMWLELHVREERSVDLARRLLGEFDGFLDVSRLDPDELLERLAVLLVDRRLIVLGRERRREYPGGGGGGQPPAPKPKPKPTPRPPPPPPPKPVLKGNLVVEIFDEENRLITTEKFDVAASGPESLAQQVGSGSHTWFDVTPGTYSVSGVGPADKFESQSASTTSTPVTPGGTGKARLDYKWLRNVVTPKIELEYKVVVLDRKLSAHQVASEDKILTDDVTYIEVSASESTGKPKYTGDGSFEVSPANVEVYTDEKCTQKLSGKIANAKLFGGPVKLYLKAVTAGKFTAKLTLDPASDAHIKVEGPATEEMGVVELKLTVHQHDIGAIGALKVDPDTEPVATYHTQLKDLVLPAQKALTDAQKIADGRLLHAQNAGHHGRAKLIVEKLDAGQWPAGTDDYQIVLAAAGGPGTLAVHGKEWDADAKGLPHTMKVAELKAAEQVLWAEGSTASAKLRDARLSLGLDRAAGGLAKTAKQNGDWARFTVVKIEEVVLDYTKAGDEHAAWDEPGKRFFININRKGNPAGRKIKIVAKLGAKFAGVPLYFMLAPDKDNTKAANWNIDFPNDGKSGASPVKWKDVPAAMKHKDRSDRKDYLHLTAKTDAEGRAEMELELSLCGGDKFHPAAYIEQDPHLAKYVHGHAELEKKQPVFAKVVPIQVWRKTWYQVTRPKDTVMPAPAGFNDSQRKVFIETLVTSERQMTKADFTVDPFRPDWQFNGGASDTPKLCVGTHNINQAMALFTAETKDTAPKFHVILCDEQFDAQGVTTDARRVVFNPANSGPQDVAMTSSAVGNGKLTVCDPPLQGGALAISATYTPYTKTGASWTAGASVALPANLIQVVKGRASKRTVRVSPPPGVPIDATHQIAVDIQLNAADGGYNGWAPNNSVANVVKGGRPAYAIHNTMGHELGHLFGKVRSTSVAGIPDHPLYYQQRGGSGTHCAFSATWNPDPTAPALNPTTPGELDAQGHGAGQYDDGRCIIFGYSVDMKREWCKHCALDFILSDLSKFG